MKKYFIFTAIAAAVAFTACTNSSDESPEVVNPGNTTAVRGKTAVGFDAYTGRTTTRAGETGLLDDAALQATDKGFGVFAYYTDLKKYDQTYVPNFMYNTHVTYNAGSWGYSPVMYWPNEYGSNAQSDDEDKVSFFAYAPYAATGSAAAGSVDTSTDPTAASWGITGFSRNTTAGDPLVKYIATFDAANSVDLCWGVVGTTEATSWNLIQTNAAQAGLVAGKPWLDVEHPKATDQKLKFTFNHALAKLAVNINADINTATTGAGDAIDVNSKVYVRSISFTGIAMKGALNLNNTTANQALWLDYSGTTDLPYGESVTIKDGRRDGREGAANADAANELPQGLNAVLVQDAGSTTAGVTKDPVSLFAGGGTVYVIPTGEAMTVTIVYDVETENTDLPGYISDGVKHGSSIENRISKTIQLSAADMTLSSGKAYTINLHLGMNSVKYDAAVGAWDTVSDPGEAWLPANSN
jgi:hypothetical protein